jgi:hypothetical protein
MSFSTSSCDLFAANGTSRYYQSYSIQLLFICKNFFQKNEVGSEELNFSSLVAHTRIARTVDPKKKEIIISDGISRALFFGACCTQGDITCEPQRKKQSSFVSSENEKKNHHQFEVVERRRGFVL